jgi:hypothetical protein
MNSPEALAFDGTYLFLADYGSSRVVRYRVSDGSYQGWIGGISSSPSSGESGCAGATGLTPGWCIGGTPSPGISDGAFKDLAGVALDSFGVIYAADLFNHRVHRWIQ